MPHFTVHAVIIAHTRFDLSIEAESDAAAELWASELLAPHGMIFDSEVHEHGVVDCDDYQICIPYTERHSQGRSEIVREGIPDYT